MLKLKAGKTYLNRRGDKVTVQLRSDVDKGYKFVSDDGRTYTAEGVHCVGMISSYDLVSEALQLEHGKTYLNREGKTETVWLNTDKDEIAQGYEFVDDDGYGYSRTGVFYINGEESRFDLIASVDDKVVPTQNVQLEDGKTYLDRNGNKHTVYYSDGYDDNYPYIDIKTDDWYTTNGNLYADGRYSEYDLISEAPVEAVSVKTLPDISCVAINKQYKTRSGEKVRLIAIDEQLSLVIGVIADAETVSFWDLTGEHRSFSNLNLVEVTPYADFAIDECVLVKDFDTVGGHRWYKRHFAGVDTNGKPLAFARGGSSYTCDDTVVWEQCVKWADRTADMIVYDD